LLALSTIFDRAPLEAICVTKAASPAATAKRRARKVQALPRLHKDRPANGPACNTLVGLYLRRRIA
jgi:hypothetical protein